MPACRQVMPININITFYYNLQLEIGLATPPGLLILILQLEITLGSVAGPVTFRTDVSTYLQLSTKSKVTL